ncbi:hypothetical protein C8R43DRAFT_961735 [Mycena crocata]|nr:hypothetical protein C8R43DRAFT_961735 [Mycena crocata]
MYDTNQKENKKSEWTGARGVRVWLFVGDDRIREDEDSEQWRQKLLNATESEVIAHFGYADITEWYTVQTEEDERKAEEAKKERLRLEQLKKDEDARLRKEQEDAKRKAAEADDEEDEGESSAKGKGKGKEKEVAGGEKSGKRRRGGTVGAEDEREAKRVKVDESRCSNCIKNDVPECVVEPPKRSCSYCVGRKIKCDRASGPGGAGFDPELFQIGVDAQEDSADSLNAILVCQRRIEKNADILRESLEDLRADTANTNELLKIAIRLAFPEQAESELAAYEARVAKDVDVVNEARDAAAAAVRKRREEEKRKAAETKAGRAERGAGGAAVAPEKRTTGAVAAPEKKI